MRYAHNLACGYDHRAATTAALVYDSAAGQVLERAPKIERAATVPKGRLEHRRIGRDAWRARLEQDGGETTSKTPQLPRVACVAFGAEESPPRAFLLAARVAVGTRRHRPLALAIWQAAAAFLPALFYRFRVPLSSRFFKRSGQRIGFAASQCVQSTHNLKAHSLASKTAAQRIKADICGSAVPPSRKG